MQARSIILGLAGLAVLVAFFMLIMDSGARSTEVKDVELDKALSAYRSGESSEASPEQPTSKSPRTKPPRIPRSRVRVKPSEESEGSVAEPYVAPPPPEVENEIFAEKVDMKTRMNEVNRLYDRADYEGSREAALQVLEENPNNVRMKRIVVSSSCIMGDEDQAKEHYTDLPTRDKRQMTRRCKRYGIEFEEGQ